MPRLLAIVNPTSGGGEGARLAQALAATPGIAGVAVLGRCDLAAELAALGSEDLVIACGGDGTASAVTQAIAGRGTQAPTLGVVPLGTGNDLARVLGWSAGCHHDLPRLVAAWGSAQRRQLDRWRLEGPSIRRSWCNYLSLGIDARVALRFHHLRLRHPHLVRGPLINRTLYGVLGAQQRSVALVRVVHLAEGMAVPAWASVLVFGNIPSYAGGARLAGRMAIDDGAFEVVALGAGVALGLVTARLRRPRLLARRSEVAFTLGTELAMQVDGEPFLAPVGHYRVVRDRSVRVLVAPGAPCLV